MKQPIWRIVVEALVCSAIIGAVLFELSGESTGDSVHLNKEVKWSNIAKRRFSFSPQAAGIEPLNCATSLATMDSSRFTQACQPIAANWGASQTCCAADPAVRPNLDQFDGLCLNYACKATFLSYWCTFSCSGKGSYPCDADVTALANDCSSCPGLATAGLVPAKSEVPATWITQTFTQKNATAFPACTSLKKQGIDQNPPVVDSMTVNTTTISPFTINIDRNSTNTLTLVWSFLVTSSSVPNLFLSWTFPNLNYTNNNANNAFTNAFNNAYNNANNGLNTYNSYNVYNGYAPTAAWVRVGATQWRNTITTITTQSMLVDGTLTATAIATNSLSVSGRSSLDITVTSFNTPKVTFVDHILCPTGTTPSSFSTVFINPETTGGNSLDCRCNGGCSVACSTSFGCAIQIASLKQTGTNSEIVNTITRITGDFTPATTSQSLTLTNSPLIMLAGSVFQIGHVFKVSTVNTIGSSGQQAATTPASIGNVGVQFLPTSRLRILAAANLMLSGNIIADSTDSQIIGLLTIVDGSYQMSTAGAITDVSGKIIARTASTVNGVSVKNGGVIKGTGLLYLAGGAINFDGAAVTTKIETVGVNVALPVARKFNSAAGITNICNTILGATANTFTLVNHQLIANVNPSCILTDAVATAAFGGARPATTINDANNVPLTLSNILMFNTYTVDALSAITFKDIAPTGTRMVHFDGNLIFQASSVAEGLVLTGSQWPQALTKVPVARFQNIANGCPAEPTAITTRALTNETCPTGRNCWFEFVPELASSRFCRIVFNVGPGSPSALVGQTTLFGSNTTFVNINKDCATYSPAEFVSDVTEEQNLSPFEVTVEGMFCGSMTVYFRCNSFVSFASANGQCQAIKDAINTPGSKLWNKFGTTSPVVRKQSNSDDAVFALFILVIVPVLCVCGMIGWYKSKQREADNQYLQDTATFSNVAAHGAPFYDPTKEMVPLQPAMPPQGFVVY